MANCPNCKQNPGWGNAIMKCGKCNAVFCARCMDSGFFWSACPFCGINVKQGTVIGRG